MTLKEILWGSGGIVVVLMTVIQIAPIRINPWTAIIKAIGRGINADVLKDLKEVKRVQEATSARLEEHIATDDKREADGKRMQILKFNGEILNCLTHSREEFIEILTVIDEYELYCKTHPDYKNNRSIHAIANIKRVYDERMIKHDFA